VQTLQPLSIADIGLAARNMFGIARIDQQHLEATLFEDFIDRNPVDPGGFHDDGFDPTALKPVRQPMQIGGKGLERADGLRIAVWPDRGDVKGGANIKGRRVRVNTGHFPPPTGPLRWSHTPLLRLGTSNGGAGPRNRSIS
jgi:hypothetical protein